MGKKAECLSQCKLQLFVVRKKVKIHFNTGSQFLLFFNSQISIGRCFTESASSTFAPVIAITFLFANSTALASLASVPDELSIAIEQDFADGSSAVYAP